MAITFITSTSSTTVTVNDSSHGALVGDFVTFSNANTGNSSLNTQLNAEHQIITVPTTGTYTITLSDNAAATLASAIPVALETNGTVRAARGFTSIK